MIRTWPPDTKRKHLFGPVASRRLGFSLGVDIIPFKTCTFDCLYCELGATTRKTAEPVEEVEAEEVLRELDEWLAQGPFILDYLTVTGSGEPTLHPRLGYLIEEIKKRSPVPVALLTNASLLYKDEVLEAAVKADVVLPSLDAPDEQVFQTVNRPHPSISFRRLLEGLQRLGRCKDTRVWLEVLLIKDLNDRPAQIAELKERIESIDPEKVQINTVVRPPVAADALPVPLERLRAIQDLLGPRAEIIVGAIGERAQLRGERLEKELLGLLARRPCTLKEITRSLGISEKEAEELVGRLLAAKKIDTEPFDRTAFYRAHPRPSQ